MLISVALATCNGEKYIGEQLQSIFLQLGCFDNVVVSDDQSKDLTMLYVKSISMLNSSSYNNPKKGLISNFENAIRHADGDIIFLCDQDDVWHPDKIATVKHYFETTDADLIVHDAYVTDENLNVIHPSFYALMNSGPGFVKNFTKNTYIGCCMAFRRWVKDIILPFPDGIPMHDSWIGLLTELNGKVLYIPEKLVYYRRHGNNASVLKRKSLLQSAAWRAGLAAALGKRQFEIIKKQKKV